MAAIGVYKTVTGIDLATGKRLWSRTGFPSWVSILAAPGGRVLVAGINTLPAPAGYPVTALSAATGETLWQLKPQGKVSALWPQGDELVIAGESANVKAPAGRMALASLATGRVRWPVESPNPHDQIAATLITQDGDVLTVANSQAVGSVTDSAARTGAARWTVTLAFNAGFLGKPQGPDVLVSVPGASADKPSRLGTGRVDRRRLHDGGGRRDGRRQRARDRGSEAGAPHRNRQNRQDKRNICSATWPSFNDRGSKTAIFAADDPRSLQVVMRAEKTAGRTAT